MINEVDKLFEKNSETRNKNILGIIKNTDKKKDTVNIKEIVKIPVKTNRVIQALLSKIPEEKEKEKREDLTVKKLLDTHEKDTTQSTQDETSEETSEETSDTNVSPSIPTITGKKASNLFGNISNPFKNIKFPDIKFPDMKYSLPDPKLRIKNIEVLVGSVENSFKIKDDEFKLMAVITPEYGESKIKINGYKKKDENEVDTLELKEDEIMNPITQKLDKEKVEAELKNFGVDDEQINTFLEDLEKEINNLKTIVDEN
jgi:hypothetical protein